MNIAPTIKRYPVMSFIILTLGLSFAGFLIPVPPEGAFATIAFLLLPILTLVALMLESVTDGRRGATQLLRHSFRWQTFTWIERPVGAPIVSDGHVEQSLPV
ncbi:MAG: hypothetical protein K8L99_33360 [Anaerolineae bacterium]|nr:hypothetical protein [Anaerolineae bacterium]